MPNPNPSLSVWEHFEDVGLKLFHFYYVNETFAGKNVRGFVPLYLKEVNITLTINITAKRGNFGWFFSAHTYMDLHVTKKGGYHTHRIDLCI